MHDIGFQQAWDLTIRAIIPLEPEQVSTSEIVGRVCARDVVAAVDYPSADCSTKDGYAVISEDIAHASPSRPVSLDLIGAIGAGGSCKVAIRPGTAVRILSGAVIPPGATAVLAEEFTHRQNGCVMATACSEPGRNILFCGSEIRRGEVLMRQGEVFHPAKAGLVVAGGLDAAWVYRRPVVGLLATGDEVLLPGKPPEAGKLFASNLALQDAWLRSRSMKTVLRQAGDSMDELTSAVTSLLNECDILITSGGAWKGDRDLIVKVLDQLGWDMAFHRVRLGPGKAVALGSLQGKPVFCLPGGPPSNEAAFLLLAFPATMRLAGSMASPYPRLTGILEEDVRGQRDWTQIVHCTAQKKGRDIRLTPLDTRRRLRSMAKADGVILIPEGVEHIPTGAVIEYLRLGVD